MKSRLTITIITCVAIVIATFTLSQSTKNNPVPQPQVTILATTTEIVTPIPSDPAMFVRGITFTRDPYRIFITQEGEDAAYADFTYTKQNVIQSGPYAGYVQVLATRTYDGPSMEGAGVFAFLTKDFKTFLVSKKYNFAATSYELFNQDVVVGVVDYAESHPAQLLYAGLKYNRAEIYQKTEYVNGYKGARLFKFGSLYAYAEDAVYQDQNTAQYIQGTSRLLVEDPYGVIFAYTKEMKDEFGVVFDSSDFVNFTNGYTSYGDAIPAACGMPVGNKVLKNINDGDLERVTATKNGLELYALKNKNHPLYHAQYARKVGEQKDYFLSVNPDYSKVPSFAEYIAKNPILIYGDTWGRWNMVGEFEYKLDGGCGKPVIYLYPEKAMDVSVSFGKSVKLTTDIPTYGNGWKVEAQPDGTLIDLQKEKTDCATIDTAKVGSEYAKEACAVGIYPYIYWAGDVISRYPVAHEGFVVAKKDLKSTLIEKLSTIGLSAKESADMLEYWYPYLLKKDFAYYRLTFFQNKEMNTFLPMNVSPKPDTVVRVFLDWEGLNEKVSIKPQVLNRIERKGFTLVEWGGLKK